MIWCVAFSAGGTPKDRQAGGADGERGGDRGGRRGDEARSGRKDQRRRSAGDDFQQARLPGVWLVLDLFFVGW